MKKQILVMTILLASVSYGQEIRPKALGSDRDKHGCIGSAGYTYSQIKKDCIRLFEQKILLKETDPKGSYALSAAIAFSEDDKKAEIFLPSSKGSVILSRTASYKSTSVYKKGGLTLIKDKENYTLKKSKKIIFNL
ncbi:hypothetical protein HHL23_22065 [Chryseobacterium sp. RP-3-3]|uniref:Uncharacterized protein n=1 Tax=Chryseobacterium antibioticum TaxID=2728847 RepID=A0A7Y0AS00_9FLAO|nr:hypothetical protein [Chryseobacterium antibioticum]NML72445.1 hypothetical protein [Chryseobacterium antibioticum]